MAEAQKMTSLYCLDCGQASCQVLILPGKRSYVFDAGGNYKRLGPFFRNYAGMVEKIFISHWHKDHFYSLIQIINFQKKFGHKISVYVPIHGPDGRTIAKTSNLKSVILNLTRLAEDQIIALKPICASEIPEIVHEDKETGIQISLLYPGWHHKWRLEGKIDKDIIDIGREINCSSAVFRISDGSKTVLFGADLGLYEWKYLLKKIDSTLFKADFFVVPHHGAPVDEGVEKDFFRKLINTIECKVVYVSVGTGNKDDHPEKEIIGQVPKKTWICCSEINCVDDIHEKLNNNMLPKHIVPQRRNFPETNGVPCMGTLRVDFQKNRFKYFGIKEQENGIEGNELLSQEAYCRKR